MRVYDVRRSNFFIDLVFEGVLSKIPWLEGRKKWKTEPYLLWNRPTYFITPVAFSYSYNVLGHADRLLSLFKPGSARWGNELSFCPWNMCVQQSEIRVTVQSDARKILWYSIFGVECVRDEVSKYGHRPWNSTVYIVIHDRYELEIKNVLALQNVENSIVFDDNSSKAICASLCGVLEPNSLASVIWWKVAWLLPVLEI